MIIKVADLNAKRIFKSSRCCEQNVGNLLEQQRSSGSAEIREKHKRCVPN